MSKLWEKGGTGKPGMLQFMELQRVGLDLVTQQQGSKHKLSNEIGIRSVYVDESFTGK